MAIHAITGVMGSGKSYEAVSEKIIPALRDEGERRIITNIEGLNYEEISKYVSKDIEEIKKRLISVSYERVSEPLFWYDPEAGATDTVVQPGDLVVLDEVWRYFNRGMQLAPDAMRFFRMHRHYVSAETSFTCDVVLINQALRGIHADIKDIIEVQFACRKLKVLGRPQNYQVSVIEGGERNASHTYLRKYSTAVFPLYSSYTVSSAKEAIDKRQSALSKPFFKVILPLAVVGIAFGSYSTYAYFRDMGKPAEGSVPAAEQQVSSAAPGAPLGTPVSSISSSSSNWRVVASYTYAGLPVFLLTDAAGRFRTITAGHFTAGVSDDLTVSMPDAPGADKATPWAGEQSTYKSSGGAK